MEMQDRIRGAMGGLERLASQIPGYRGYKERETAREADKLVRDRLVQAIQREADRLLEIERAMVDGGGIRLISQVETAARRLQTLADTVRTASYGYAGLFDPIKVQQPELEAMVNHDASLMADLPAVSAAVDALSAAGVEEAAVKAATSSLMEAIAGLSRHWEERREVILRLAQGGGTASDSGLPAAQ